MPVPEERVRVFNKIKVHLLYFHHVWLTCTMVFFFCRKIERNMQTTWTVSMETSTIRLGSTHCWLICRKCVSHSILLYFLCLCLLREIHLNDNQNRHCNLWRIIEFTGRNGTSSFDLTLEQYGVYEIIDWIVQHLSRHPFLAFGMSMCVLSCALPFIIFMIFAIATVIMTFTSFVIIEGQWRFASCRCLFFFVNFLLLHVCFTD